MTLAVTQPRSRKPKIDLRALDDEQLFELAESLRGQPIPGVRMSEAEFEKWAYGLRAEWLDGEIVLMSPANNEHADINMWLITLLRMYIEEHDLGIIRADVSVRFALLRRRRNPDLFFVSADRQHLLKETYFDGAPDVAIEIVSPDSQSRDRRDKYGEYQRVGVREYWIIDPLSQTVELYKLERKRFKLVDEVNGSLESSAIRGLRIRPAELWKKPLPKVSTVLRRLAAGK